VDFLAAICSIWTPSLPASRALGIVQTTWCGFGSFVAAHKALAPDALPAKTAPAESAHCFVTLFKAMREP
jgi:hypothetical protein